MYRLFIFFLLPIFVFSQKSKQSIDSLIDVTDRHFKNYEDALVFSNSQKILVWSSKHNYPIGKVHAYYYLSCVMFSIGEHRKSLDFIKKIKLEKKIPNYQGFYCKVYGSEADNYFSLGLHKLSVESNHKALELLKENTTENNIKRSYLYANLNDFYYNTGRQDSAVYYLNKEKENLKLLDPDKNFSEVAFAYIGVGEHYTRIGKKDSAIIYLNRSRTIYEKHSHPHAFHAYFALGDYYFEEGRFQDALTYYKKALSIVKIIKVKESEKEAYKKIANTYASLRSTEGKDYLSRYALLNDSLSGVYEKDRNYILNDALLQKDEAYETLESKAYKSALLGALVVILLLAVILFYFKNFKKKSAEFENQSEQLLSENDILNKEKNKVSQELYHQQHSSLDELIHLAKTNDSAFLARFEEVFPHFVTNLLGINSTLVRSELRFCALLYFNFSIKDIAEYTFTAPKTVQNRKNRIRKRLDIPLEENISLWMQKMVS